MGLERLFSSFQAVRRCAAVARKEWAERRRQGREGESTAAVEPRPINTATCSSAIPPLFSLLIQRMQTGRQQVQRCSRIARAPCERDRRPSTARPAAGSILCTLQLHLVRTQSALFEIFSGDFIWLLSPFFTLAFRLSSPPTRPTQRIQLQSSATHVCVG